MSIWDALRAQDSSRLTGMGSDSHPRHEEFVLVQADLQSPAPTLCRQDVVIDGFCIAKIRIPICAPCKLGGVDDDLFIHSWTLCPDHL